MPKTASKMTQAVDTPEGLGFVWWPERQQQLELLQHLLRYSDLSILIEGPAGSGKTEVLKRAFSQMNQELAACAWIDAKHLTSSLDVRFEELSESKTTLTSLLVIDNADVLNKRDKYQLNHWLKTGIPRLILTTQGASFSETLDTRFHQLSLTPIPLDKAKHYWSTLYGAKTPRPESLWPGDVTQPKPSIKDTDKVTYRVQVILASTLSLLILFSVAAYYELWTLTDDTSSLMQSKDQINSEKFIQSQEPSINLLLNESVSNKETHKNAKPLNKENINSINQPSTLLSEDPIKDWVLSHYSVDKDVNATSESESAKSLYSSKKSINSFVKNTKTSITDANVDKKDTFKIEPGEANKITKQYLVSESVDHPLNNLPRSNYSFQLLGTRNKKNAQNFINKYSSMSQPFWIYPAMFKDKLWYVVVYGNFSSRQQALNAKKRFPSALLKEKPWLRAIGNIQKEIYSP